MRNGNFTFSFILLLIAQICICNYLRITQFMMVSILPAMILLLPMRTGRITSLFIAFICGLVVDYFGDGLLGLNACALLPVAFLRSGIIGLVCGEDVLIRMEDVSISRHGLLKISLCILMALALYLIVYIWIDGARTRPLWFNVCRFTVSLFSGYIFSLLVVNSLTPERQS